MFQQGEQYRGAEDWLNEQADGHLGAMAEMFIAQDDMDMVGLVVEAHSLVYTYAWDDGDGTDYYHACLYVPGRLVPGCGEAKTDRLKQAIESVIPMGARIARMGVRAQVAGPNWREQVIKALGEGTGITNQARLMRRHSPNIFEDGLAFRSMAELNVYRGFKRIGRTIALYPCAAVKIAGTGTVLEVDLLVCYRGRAGVVEVDGPSHATKRAADRSRDHLLEDAGIEYVDRIDVADTDKPEEVDQFVERFLRKLSGD